MIIFYFSDKYHQLRDSKEYYHRSKKEKSIIQSEVERILIRVTPEFKEILRTCSLHKNSLLVFRLIETFHC